MLEELFFLIYRVFYPSIYFKILLLTSYDSNSVLSCRLLSPSLSYPIFLFSVPLLSLLGPIKKRFTRVLSRTGEISQYIVTPVHFHSSQVNYMHGIFLSYFAAS